LQGIYHLAITGIQYHEFASRLETSGTGHTAIAIISDVLRLNNMGTADAGTNAPWIDHTIYIYDKSRFYYFTSPIYTITTFNGDFYIRIRNVLGNNFIDATRVPNLLINWEAERIHDLPERPLRLIQTLNLNLNNINRTTAGTNIASPFRFLRQGRYKIRLNGALYWDSNNAQTLRTTGINWLENWCGTDRVCSHTTSTSMFPSNMQLVATRTMLYRMFEKKEWVVIEYTGRDQFFQLVQIFTAIAYFLHRVYLDIIAID